jgi:hypothetical protein
MRATNRDFVESIWKIRRDEHHGLVRPRRDATDNVIQVSGAMADEKNVATPVFR